MRTAVIGGGAGGMLAAIVLAQGGVQTVLFEKNDKLGKKVYITGKGRCNMTNLCSPDEFLKNVVSNPKFLFSAIHKFSSQNCVDFFNGLGLETVTERGNRVFPSSQKASDVTKTLEREMKRLGVEIRLETEICAVKPILVEQSETEYKGFKLSWKQQNSVKTEMFDKVIIATGGVSYPSTGSTGDGWKFARELKLKTVEPKQSLVEIMTCEDVSALEGLSLKNVELSAYADGKKVDGEFGEMLFTRRGISGPIALTLSSRINRLSNVSLLLDLKPALDYATLDARILREFAEGKNCQLKNVLRKLEPERLVDLVLRRSSLSGEKPVNAVGKDERKVLVHTIKGIKFEFKKLGGFEEAVVTAGGVDVKELKPTMESRKYNGLYFVGETVDVDALTGGFNLQIAWATAYVAATDVVKNL